MPPQHHPDFSLPWCHRILTSPSTTITESPTSAPKPPPGSSVSNTMFQNTLYHPGGIRAQINFFRPALDPSAIISPVKPNNATDHNSVHSKVPSSSSPLEYCDLLSLGPDLDGKAGRAHGGFNALVLDHILGSMAAMMSGSMAPATATMTVDYKRPVDTPGVVLARAWLESLEGRKVWVKGRIEDGEGRELAIGRALFVVARREKI